MNPTTDDLVQEICHQFHTCSDGCPFKVNGEHLCTNTRNEDLILEIYSSFKRIPYSSNLFTIAEDDILSIIDS